MSKPTIAIIGYGEFSKLMIRILQPYGDFVVNSRQEILKTQGLSFKPVDLATALSQNIIIPSMPAQFLEEFFTKNKQLVNPNALVVDVCSVKVKPTEVLLRVLPKTTQILATHPLFGPSSTLGGLSGQKIMLYPARIPKARYKRLKTFLVGELKLQVIEVSPKEHDQVMAYAQGLSHYIGRAMQLMDIPRSQLSTKAYNDLLDMKQVQGSDSWALFESIMFENPYALEINKKFKQTLHQLDRQLGIK